MCRIVIGYTAIGVFCAIVDAMMQPSAQIQTNKFTRSVDCDLVYWFTVHGHELTAFKLGISGFLTRIEQSGGTQIFALFVSIGIRSYLCRV